MKHTITIRVIVGVVVLIIVGATWLQDGRPDLALLKLFSAAVLACVAVLNIWDFWLWRIPLIQKYRGATKHTRNVERHPHFLLD